MTPAARDLRRLRALRKSVDGVDRRILRLLNSRLALVRRIATVKRAGGIPVHIPRREEAILRSLARANRGPLSAGSLRTVFRAVIRASRAYERREMGSRRRG